MSDRISSDSFLVSVDVSVSRRARHRTRRRVRAEAPGSVDASCMTAVRSTRARAQSTWRCTSARCARPQTDIDLQTHRETHHYNQEFPETNPVRATSESLVLLAGDLRPWSEPLGAATSP